MKDTFLNTNIPDDAVIGGDFKNFETNSNLTVGDLQDRTEILVPNIYLAPLCDVEKDRGITINFSGNILERFKNAAKNNKAVPFKFNDKHVEHLNKHIPKSPSILVITDKDGNTKIADVTDIFS